MQVVGAFPHDLRLSKDSSTNDHIQAVENNGVRTSQRSLSLGTPMNIV